MSPSTATAGDHQQTPAPQKSTAGGRTDCVPCGCLGIPSAVSIATATATATHIQNQGKDFPNHASGRVLHPNLIPKKGTNKTNSLES